MDFDAVLGVLVGSGVEVILIGGVAGFAHGSARLTQDIDFVYRRSDENLERLMEALRPYHPYLRGAPPGLPFRFDAETLKRGLNFTFTSDLGDIDLLGEVTGGGRYEDLAPQCETLDVYGHRVLCLTLGLLIATKRAAGRPKDFEAIAELEALEEERRDMDET